METPKLLKRNMRVEIEPSIYLKKELAIVNIELYKNSTFNFMHLEQYIINNSFKIHEKYNTTQELFSIHLANNIIFSKRCQITLNYNEMKKQRCKEYIKRFYTKTEAGDRLPKIWNYYKNFQRFFCRPLFIRFEINILLQGYLDEIVENYFQKNHNQIVKKGDNDINDRKIFTTTLKDDIQKHTLTKSLINVENTYNISTIANENTQNTPLQETIMKDSCLGNLLIEINHKNTTRTINNTKKSNPSMKKLEGLKEKIQENITNYLNKSPSKKKNNFLDGFKKIQTATKLSPSIRTKRKFSTVNTSSIKTPSMVSSKSLKQTPIVSFSPKKNVSKVISSPSNIHNNTIKSTINHVESIKPSHKVINKTKSAKLNKSKDLSNLFNYSTKRKIIDLNSKAFNKQSINLYKGRDSKYLEKTQLFSPKNKPGCSERTLSFDNKSFLRKDINTSKSSNFPTKGFKKDNKKTKQVFTSLYNYPKNNSNMISISVKNLNVSPSPIIFTKNTMIHSPVNKILLNSDSQKKNLSLYQSYSVKKKF